MCISRTFALSINIQPTEIFGAGAANEWGLCWRVCDAVSIYWNTSLIAADGAAVGAAAADVIIDVQASIIIFSQQNQYSRTFCSLHSFMGWQLGVCLCTYSKWKSKKDAVAIEQEFSLSCQIDGVFSAKKKKKKLTTKWNLIFFPHFNWISKYGRFLYYSND